MDIHSDLLTYGSALGEPDAVRALGWNKVRPMNTPELTAEECVALWAKFSSQDYMFSDFERGNFEGFLIRLRDMRHLHLDLSGAGYAILLNAWCCDNLELHFCLWHETDKREILTMGAEIMNFAFGQMKAHRITGFIPVINPMAIKLANMLSFKFEGSLADAFTFHGKHYDVHAYGLLQKDWLARERRINGRN